MFNLKKRLKLAKHLLLISLLSIVLFFGSLPVVNNWVGNLFFGKMPSLYNVTLAQFFFARSSYPFIGKTPPYAHYQLSRTYFIKGELSNALLEAHEELKKFPENKRTHYILGLTYAYLNMENQAILEFSKFIEWKPESWAARNDKAWLEFRIGKIDDAIATIEPVTHLTNNPWVQNTYGTLLMNKKRYQKAKQALLYAQAAATSMTEEDWGKAYPGNDPRVYSVGLSAMRNSIESNLKLVEEKMP